MAGRRAKALRIARAKLVKKTRAHARAEEEAEALEKEQEDLQEKIRNKRKEVDEIKEEMQAAQVELEKLAKSEDLGEEADEEGADAGQPLGPQARAQLLAQQLLSFVPGAYKDQLQELVRKAMKENEQKFSGEWCVGKGSGKGAEAKPHVEDTRDEAASPHKEAGKEDGGGNANDDDMADLEARTIEQLELLKEVLDPAEEGKEDKAASDDKSNRLSAIKTRGAVSSKVAKVIKDLKDKQGKKAKARSAASTGSRKGDGEGAKA
jgi:hypothetical protein